EPEPKPKWGPPGDSPRLVERDRSERGSVFFKRLGRSQRDRHGLGQPQDGVIAPLLQLRVEEVPVRQAILRSWLEQVDRKRAQRLRRPYQQRAGGRHLRLAPPRHLQFQRVVALQSAPRPL